MKIYLASRLSHRKAMLGIRKTLQDAGHEVTSRWIDGENDDETPESMRQFAIIDKEDVEAADCCILFTEQPRCPTRGGRMVEFGMALALDKLCIAYGPPENVFQYHPDVKQFTNWPDVMSELALSELAWNAQDNGLYE